MALAGATRPGFAGEVPAGRSGRGVWQGQPDADARAAILAALPEGSPVGDALDGGPRVPRRRATIGVGGRASQSGSRVAASVVGPGRGSRASGVPILDTETDLAAAAAIPSADGETPACAGPTARAGTCRRDWSNSMEPRRRRESMADNRRGSPRGPLGATEIAFYLSGCLDLLGAACLVLLLLARLGIGFIVTQSADYPPLANAWVYALALFGVTGVAHVAFLLLGRRLFGEHGDSWASIPGFIALLRGRLLG